MYTITIFQYHYRVNLVVRLTLKINIMKNKIINIKKVRMTSSEQDLGR